MSQAVKLTASFIKKIEQTGAKFFVWDAAVSGFGVRVTPKGFKSFVARVRVGGRGGRQNEETLGPVPKNVTSADVEKARAEAYSYIQRRRGDKNTDVLDMTFKEAVELYLDYMRKKYNIPHEPDGQNKNVNKWPKHPRAVAYGLRRCVDFEPRKGDDGYEIWKKKGKSFHAGLGHLKFSDLTDGQIGDIISQIAEQSLSSAHNVRGYLSAMFNHFKRTTNGKIYNVVEATPKIKVRRSVGVLNYDEMRLFDEVLQSVAMEGYKKSVQANACRVMLWSGTRVEELLTLKWQDDGDLESNFVDLDQRLMHFRKHKTDNDTGETTSVAISDYAYEVLLQLKRSNYKPKDPSNPYVFFSDWSKTGHICQKTLNEFFKRHVTHVYREFGWPAYKQKLTLYNLRHSLVSYLLNDKQLNLHIVAMQVKHRDIRTTVGYQDKSSAALQQVRDAIGKPESL